MPTRLLANAPQKFHKPCILSYNGGETQYYTNPFAHVTVYFHYTCGPLARFCGKEKTPSLRVVSFRVSQKCPHGFQPMAHKILENFMNCLSKQTACVATQKYMTSFPIFFTIRVGHWLKAMWALLDHPKTHNSQGRVIFFPQNPANAPHV
jgi:hypothetical protein